MHDGTFYLYFVLHAVLGKMAEADAIMRMASEPIKSVATFLARKYPVPAQPIYRGLLLDPKERYAQDSRLTFMSWSEDRDVAMWFADTRASVSEPVALLNPWAQGYIAELAQPRSQVLFHHSWDGPIGGLAPLAKLHPLMGASGMRQIVWALRTQQEVITLPCEIAPCAVTELDHKAFEALEARLAPPWLDDEEFAVTVLSVPQGCVADNAN